MKNIIIFVKFLSQKDIIDNKDCIKIPVVINSKNPKRPINRIGTTGRINYANTFEGEGNKKSM